MDKQRFIELCKTGDEYALGLLYETYAGRMKAVCFHYVKDETVAEDILHDGFIIIMSSIHQLKDAAKLEVWMATIMRNLALRHLHRNEHAVLIPIEDIEENGDLADKSVEIVSEYKKLLKLVDTLPDGYKSVFKLAVFDGMSHKEIGRMLGINPHSSSSQLARAREMLRNMVKNYGFVSVVLLALLHSLQLDMPDVNRSKTNSRASVTEEAATPRQAEKIIMTETRRHSQEVNARIAHVDTLIKNNYSQPADTTTEHNENINRTVPYKEIADKTSVPILKKSTKHEWNISASYSSGAESNSSVLKTKPGSFVSGEEIVEQKTNHYMPFVVSLSLQKTLNRNWSIGTGIRYTRLKTDITTIGKDETTFSTQTVEYIGLPVNITYNMWKSGNLSFYTSAGIAADIPLSGSKKWQWSVSTGAGLQYQLTPGISIFAEPSLNWHINSTHGTPTIWTDRPFDLSVPFGLRFSW